MLDLGRHNRLNRPLHTCAATRAIHQQLVARTVQCFRTHIRVRTWRPPVVLSSKLQAAMATEAEPAKNLQALWQSMRAADSGLPREEGRNARGPALARTFTPSAAAAWLTAERGMPESEARALLVALQETNLLSVASEPNTNLAATLLDEPVQESRTATRSSQEALLLRLAGDEPLPRLGEPLNGGHCWFGPARDAATVAEVLRKAILSLYGTHLSEDGRGVDYTALKADPDFALFVAATAELQKVDVYGLNREERLSLFLNLYNALIVHGLVLFGAPSNTLERLRFFDNIGYDIGGVMFSSNDMEHGVLRGNAASPAHPWSLLGRPQWAPPAFAKAADPRAALAILPVDPRIHFALVCGAKSCPPIRVYTPQRLEYGLMAAAKVFCNGEVSVDAERRTVELSMIFKWYGRDFGSREAMLAFIASQLDPPAGDELHELLKDPKQIRLVFRHYDWSMNHV